MQNEIKAPHSGRLTKVNYGAGDYVEAGSILFTIE
jgi:biotin carboxyl carrier protein